MDVVAALLALLAAFLLAIIVRTRKVEGALRIFEREGGRTYTIEIYVPLDTLSKKDQIRLKVIELEEN